MSISVSIISKYETFMFSAQYNLKTSPIQAESIDPMVQLYFYSLLDELQVRLIKQKQEDAQDYYFPGFQEMNGQKISIFQTFNGNTFFLQAPLELGISDEMVKQFFFQLHKIYCLEIMNPFYRDGASVVSEQLTVDVGLAMCQYLAK